MSAGDKQVTGRNRALPSQGPNIPGLVEADAIAHRYWKSTSKGYYVQVKSGSIAVGGLFSQTGVTSFVERTQRQAFLLAIDEINTAGGVLGRPLEAYDSDPGSKPSQFADEAERLIKSGVRMIFGCYMSSTRRAVLPVVERNDALLFYPTFYEGFEFSDHCIYSGATPNQSSVYLADYLARSVGERFYFLGSNYNFPYESNRIMRDLIQNRGGKVVEERYIPLDVTPEHIDQVIADIRHVAPDAIFLTVIGDAAPMLCQAYLAAGFDAAMQPITSISVGEAEIAAMGAEAAAGHIVSAPYFQCIDTPRNARFVAAFQNRFGPTAPIPACSEAVYTQVHLFAEAARLAGSVDRRAVLEALPSVLFDAPQGAVRVEKMTHHTYLKPRIGKVRSDGSFEIVAEASGPVRPDPYMTEHKQAGWGKAENG
jgi:branched-chain amino acid transport system substrate-binding protein